MSLSPTKIIAQAVAVAAPTFKPESRADLYDALASVTSDPEIKARAEEAANAIREAEVAQARFKSKTDE